MMPVDITSSFPEDRPVCKFTPVKTAMYFFDSNDNTLEITDDSE